MKFPQAKAAVAALLPVGQLFLSLYADQTLSADELKLLAAEVVAVFLVWLTPAPGYVAPQDKSVGHPAEVNAAVQALAPLVNQPEFHEPAEGTRFQEQA